MTKPKTTLTDRIAMAISPKWGLNRVMNRAKADILMNYDAATTGRRANAVKAPMTDADTASSSRARLRFVSRDAIRNRPYATRAQQVITTNVVGAAITPSVQAESSTVRSNVTALIKEHLMTSAIDAQGVNNIAAMQRIVMNTVFADGEIFVRLRPRSGRFARDLALPFTIELFEADQLDTSKLSNGRNPIIDGIEYDPIGKAVAYHIMKRHPGASLWPTMRRAEDTERVRASDILHIRRLDRAGQKRGVPWLAPVFLTLTELSDYQEAQIMKQRMSALLAWFIESLDGTSAYDGEDVGELGPGSVVGLAPGQKVVSTEPPTVTGYSDFMDEGLHSIAAGLGITHASLSGKLKGINFTSGRMGRTDMDPYIETIQHQVIIGQFCTGVAKWFNDYARVTSRANPDDYEITWTAPRRALVDPTKEIPAIIKSIDSGLTSVQREQRRLGNDPDVIEAERIEDAQRDTIKTEEVET
jgi:lambda family phage portal protein